MKFTFISSLLTAFIVTLSSSFQLMAVDMHGVMCGGEIRPADKAVVESYKISEIKEGDIYLINDSYIVGSHLNDMTVLSPIFYKKKLIGFGATKAHWMDIGAKSPSSATDSTEIYQEGYRLGPTRAFKEGKPEKNIIDF